MGLIYLTLSGLKEFLLNFKVGTMSRPAILRPFQGRNNRRADTDRERGEVLEVLVEMLKEFARS